MQQWDVVVVVISLIGVFAAVIPPIVKLTRAITRLTFAMESVQKDMTELTTNNTTSHERLWAHENRQDAILTDHESRIRVMEEDTKSERK